MASEVNTVAGHLSFNKPGTPLNISIRRSKDEPTTPQSWHHYGNNLEEVLEKYGNYFVSMAASSWEEDGTRIEHLVISDSYWVPEKHRFYNPEDDIYFC